MDQLDSPSEDQLALQPKPQCSQAWTATEDWTGMSNAKKRRRLQNRLNQRAWRSRQKLKHNPSPKSNDKSPDSSMNSENSVASGNGSNRENSSPIENRLVCRMGDSRRQRLVEQLTRQAWYEYQSGAPCHVHLLALTKINVFRALRSNAAIIGCSVEWLECDSLSRIQLDTDPSTWQSSGLAEPGNWPNALQPTGVQKTVSHHPWIDLLPLARLRENLLKVVDDIDEDALCYDIVDIGVEGGGGEPALIVWGQPWDPYGWEVSVAFLRKWGWLLQGCDEILNSTNYWRGVRGERPLKFGTLLQSPQ